MPHLPPSGLLMTTFAILLGACLPQPKTACQTTDHCAHGRVCLAGTCQAADLDASLDVVRNGLLIDGATVPAERPETGAIDGEEISEVGVPHETRISILNAVLPSVVRGPAVFSDGQSVYIAGGLDDGNTVLSEVVRFSPALGTVTVMPEFLPFPIFAAGVAWTGDSAYLFGGLGDSEVSRRIIRYQPSTGAMSVLSAQLPIAAYNTAAVWTGSAIYVLGGTTNRHTDQILKYDPATDSLTPLPTPLQVGVEAPAVFWDGSLVWVLGGKADSASISSGMGSDAIQTFDPVSGQVSLRGKLPYAVWDASVFAQGVDCYLAGGLLDDRVAYTSILRFNPKTRSANTLDSSLPLGITGRVGTWVASMGAGYICGGADSNGRGTNKIIQVVP
jgi:hypothetical protein